MKTSFYTPKAIPLTHVLLACTVTTLATAFALLHEHSFMVLLCYALAGIVTIKNKNKVIIIPLLACALFSLQVFFKIESINHAYGDHQNFLNKPVTLRATILQKQTAQLNKEQTTLLIQTSHIYFAPNNRLHTPKKILLLLPAKRGQRLYEGQTITIFNIKLQQPEPKSEYEAYLIKEGVWATAYATSESIRIANATNRSWYHICSTLFASYLQDATINLFNPLFLGKREKTIQTVTTQHQSLYWGIAHHMARSGIHLVTLFGLCMTLLHYARVRYFYRYLICGLLAFGYFEISVCAVSFLRAFWMILFQIISKMNGFQYSSVHALTLTTLLMVGHNPWYILFLDFQLSFGITAVIIWIFQAKWAQTIAFHRKTLVPFKS